MSSSLNDEFAGIIKVLSRSVTQSGKAKQGKIIFIYKDNKKTKLYSPLTGLEGESDMRNEIILSFDHLDDAIRYSEKNHISYKIITE